MHAGPTTTPDLASRFPTWKEPLIRVSIRHLHGAGQKSKDVGQESHNLSPYLFYMHGTEKKGTVSIVIILTLLNPLHHPILGYYWEKWPPISQNSLQLGIPGISGKGWSAGLPPPCTAGRRGGWGHPAQWNDSAASPLNSGQSAGRRTELYLRSWDIAFLNAVEKHNGSSTG